MRTLPTITELKEREEFVVIIKMKSQPNNLRLTYTKRVGGRLYIIDEIDATEQVITTSTFSGRNCKGFCSDDIKNLKPLLGGVKPSEWPEQSQYVDSFYKIN